VAAFTKGVLMTSPLVPYQDWQGTSVAVLFNKSVGHVDVSGAHNLSEEAGQ